MENDTEYCPMIKDDCPGQCCMLWGDILVDGCDMTVAYNAMAPIARHLYALNETNKEIASTLKEIAEHLDGIHNCAGALT